MVVIKKIKFTEEQKKKYQRLKIVTSSVGIIGLISTLVFYMFGYRDVSNIIISITLAILVIFTYHKYRKILSKSKTTIRYSKFQKEVYCKAFILFLIPMIIGGSIIAFLSFEYQISPWWLLIFFIVCSIIVVIWAALYEKKKFGSIMRAP